MRSSTRTVGRFRYEVVLPSDVHDEGCDATFKDGVLTIRVPKGERERARHIDIT